MKARKSTVVLIVVILVTLVLGGVAVYTAVLLNQKKAQERAQAATFCNYLSVGDPVASFQSNGKFTLSIPLTNPSSSTVTGKIQALISHCTSACANSTCDEICTERLVYGSSSEDWKTVSIAGGGSQTITFSDIDTGFDASCGKLQYDVRFIDFQAAGQRNGDTAACMEKLLAVDTVSGGEACEAECTITPSEISNKNPGDDVIFTATVGPDAGLGAADYTYAWTDAPAEGDFTFADPDNELVATYAIPDDADSQITVDFNANYSMLDLETIGSAYDGAGYNALPGDKLASTHYLSSVSNNVTAGTRPATTSTSIYVYNPTSSAVSATVTFYSMAGAVSGTETISNIPANGTKYITTSDSSVFGNTAFDGSASVTTGSANTYVAYEKMYRDSSGHMRVWGMEGIPASSAGTGANLTPLTNEGWGADQTFVTVYNTGNTTASIEYALCGGWQDNENFGCAWGGTMSLAAHATGTIDVHSEITEQTGDGGGGIEQIQSDDNPWRGQIGIASTGSNIVAVSEEVWTSGVAGSSGYQARGRGNVFGSPTADEKLCFVSMAKELWGASQTGYGYSDTSGSAASSTLSYYNGFSGFAGRSIDGQVIPLLAYGSEIGQITGPGAGFYGSAIASSSDSIIGGIQDKADDDNFGRATAGIPCDAGDITNVLYVSGLKNALGYTGTTSIPVFNPTDNAETVKTTLYNPDGTVAATFEMYLIPKTTRFTLLAGLVPPEWYGSAKIEVEAGQISGTTGIVGVATTISRANTSSGIISDSSTCSATINFPTGVMSCTLDVTPETVAKGQTATGTLTIRDDENVSTDRYSVDWSDLPVSGTFGADPQTLTTLTGTNTYTVSSSADSGPVELTASVTKTGSSEGPITCSDTITVTDTPTGFGCTSVDVSDSSPDPGDDITATVSVYNPENETVTYTWADAPASGGSFSPDDEDEVTYSVSESASGTITLSATVTAAGDSDTCSTTITVGGGNDDDDDGGQPDTAIFSPVLYMTVGGAALAGSGIFFAGSASKIGRSISSTMRSLRFRTRRFEDRILSKVAGERKRVK